MSSHVARFLLDTLRGRTPNRWYTTGDLNRILNAERGRNGKPPIRAAVVSSSLKQLASRGLAEQRQFADGGYVRNEWRATPKSTE